jgi:hypothetical protein
VRHVGQRAVDDHGSHLFVVERSAGEQFFATGKQWLKWFQRRREF